MFYKNKDFSLYYEVHGSSDKHMLILPGWGDTRKTFAHFIEYYKKKYRVWIMDYPGFGKSTFPERDLTIYDYAILIKEFMEDKKIVNPILIAHSFGGRIATLLTTYLKVRIDRMLFMDTAGIRRKSLKRSIRQIIYKVRKKLSLLLPKAKRESYLKRLRLKYGSIDYNNLSSDMIKTFSNVVREDLRDYISKIPSEVLLIWGMLDSDTPIQDGYYFNKKIKGSAIIIFPKGTHFTYLEYPCLILNIIDKFIEN